MVLLMLMARRKDVMGRFVIGGPLYWLGWLSTAAMMLSVVAMGVGFFVSVGWVERSDTHHVRAATADVRVSLRSTQPTHRRTQSFRNTIDAIHPVISAMKAVISP